MKKLGMLALAALLVVSFTIPAWAMESQFGGYWRTRMYTNQNFTGEDESEAMDQSLVDTRTRLYYTAVFHENLKFVNKFEFDAKWGDTVLGDIGADGKIFEIKNSYADFNLGPVNAKVGIQGGTLARGFLFSDDFSGAVVTFQGNGISLPFFWIKTFEGGTGPDANDMDVDLYAFAPSFNLGGGMVKVNPYVAWVYSDDVSGWNPYINYEDRATPELKANDLNAEEYSIYYGGIDVDLNFDAASVWLTGIYQGGTIDLIGGNEIDVSAWLAAVGGKVNFGVADVHGQFFYATGDDDDDEDYESFFFVSQNQWTGQSYYWAELMGYGIFDDIVSNNSPADKISNIMAANIGTTIKPMDKLSITLDVWYAALAEDIMVGTDEENYLGTEVDLKITYQLMKGLKLDVVGAYLFAGEATTMDHPDEADPYEVGTQLSLSF